MATVQSIFFKPSRGYKEYRIGEDGKYVAKDSLFKLDGVIKEQHSSNVQVTKHPVEFGVDITSHVIKQPMKVVVDGIVTNSPSLKQMANRLPGSAEFGMEHFNDQVLGTFMGSRARDAYKGLIELQNKRQPVQLQTGLLQYSNMVLTGIRAPNDLQNNLRVQLTFEEVFIVGNNSEGLNQASTNKATEVDFATAAVTLAGLSVAGVSLLISNL